ncbi:hypothetical protein [Salidesulfovibrio onnuriiensis]|uniref:hypothetical protein n=1 Tax=Salidesulfovibrio onnuriiensis TaxID=2583823 RepID=UPI0011CC2527|nr:hypothetical protein [Salidesulfovibrio onnuriiensis]
MQEALKEFMDGWADNGSGAKEVFTTLKAHLEGLDGVRFEFNARPGVTYSLRARHENQEKRPLFAMVDVIDDDPSDRWLSVCFYGELINDPDELGDFVPEGLLGEDAACFDLEENDAPLVAYVKDRLSEACANAAKG